MHKVYSGAVCDSMLLYFINLFNVRRGNTYGVGLGAETTPYVVSAGCIRPQKWLACSSPLKDFF